MFSNSRSCLGRENFNLEDVSIRLAFRQLCQAFSWFVIGVGGPIALWLGPLLCGCSWVEQKSKLHKPQGARFWVVFLHGLWVRSAFRSPPWVPVLTFLTDGQNESINQANPSYSRFTVTATESKPGKLFSIRFDLDLIATKYILQNLYTDFVLQKRIEVKNKAKLEG